MTGDQGPIRNVLIRGNTFSRLPNDAVFTDADRVTVERNEFDHIKSPDNNWAHADVFQGMGATDVTIRDNFAHDNDSGILETIARVRGWVIENNVFLRSESWPLQLDNELQDLKLVNNTFWGGGPVLLRWNDQQPPTQPLHRRQQHLQPPRLRPPAQPPRGLEHRVGQLPAQPLRPAGRASA